MYEYYNPNPFQLQIDDCYKRALAKALDISWDMAHVLLSNSALKMGRNDNHKETFMAVLRQNHFDREAVPNTCPDCYTLEDFANEHFKGTYIVDTGSHVVCIKDGIIFDTWDSRSEIPHFYWKKREEGEES